MLPVGIQHSVKTKSVLGNGVIVDAKDLVQDLDALADNGIDVTDRLFISNRYFLIYYTISFLHFFLLELTWRQHSTRR
jgi:adenylosuccinate synthase